MMPIVLVLFFAAIGIVLLNNSRAATPTVPHLKTAGNTIVTENGQPVTLRGANVLRSEWNLTMDAERKAIPALANDWKGNVMVRGYASDPVNNPNFSWTSSWGDTVSHTRYMSWLDEHVALAEANRMYVVFAWRSYGINGHQPPMPDDAAQRSLANLAARYKGNPHVLFAVQVEPHDVSWDQLHPRFVSMIDAVRSASAPYKPIVMVSGTSWGRDISGAITKPIPRDNIVYKTHQYNSKNDFQRYFIGAHDAGLPVFIGEFGHACDSTICMAMDDVNTLMTIAAQRNIGWAAWAFDFQGGPAMVTDNTSFNPTDPYGTAVKNEMIKTPALPQPGTTPPPPPPAEPVIVGAGIHNDSIFTYNGTWMTSSGTAKYNNDDHYSDTAGSTYSVAFNGAQLKIYTSKDAHHGIMGVRINSSPEILVDTYSPTRADQSLVYTSDALPSGTHTVTVRVTGAKNTAATGTVIAADKLEVLSSITTTLPGDTNNDSRINAIDLSIVLSRDGQNYPAADFNKDGVVGAADMAILLGKWTW